MVVSSPQSAVSSPLMEWMLGDCWPAVPCQRSASDARFLRIETNAARTRGTKPNNKVGSVE